MNAIALDTHAFIKRMTGAGMPEAQAEAVTALVREVQASASSELATKADLLALKVEIREDIAPLKTEAVVMRWMLGVVLALQTAILVKLFV